MEHFLTIPWIIYSMETFSLHGHVSNMKFAFSLFLLIPNSPVQASPSYIPLAKQKYDLSMELGAY